MTWPKHRRSVHSYWLRVLSDKLFLFHLFLRMLADRADVLLEVSILGAKEVFTKQRPCGLRAAACLLSMRSKADKHHICTRH